MAEQQTFARLDVETRGVWRVSQVAEVFSALDGLTGRLAAASRLAEACEEFSYVISNLRALGLLKKRELEDWGQAPGGMAAIARTDYVDFVSNMRNAGVEVRRARDAVVYRFNVQDLLDIVPPAHRLEVERITMASPGIWSFLMSGVLAAPKSIELLDKILEALFFRNTTAAIKRAEARQRRAEAREVEAKARQQEVLADVAEARAVVQRAEALVDYSGALFTLADSLRRAGFEEANIKTMVSAKIEESINSLARYRASGHIQHITLKQLTSPGRTNHDVGPTK